VDIKRYAVCRFKGAGGAIVSVSEWGSCGRERVSDVLKEWLWEWNVWRRGSGVYGDCGKNTLSYCQHLKKGEKM
jgi:hypothetical protein